MLDRRYLEPSSLKSLYDVELEMVSSSTVSNTCEPLTVKKSKEASHNCLKKVVPEVQCIGLSLYSTHSLAFSQWSTPLPELAYLKFQKRLSVFRHHHHVCYTSELFHSINDDILSGIFTQSPDMQNSWWRCIVAGYLWLLMKNLIFLIVW